MNLFVFSHSDLLISLLRTVLANTDVHINIVKNSLSLDKFHITSKINNSSAIIIDTHLLNEKELEDWICLAKVSKITNLLVNTKYQNLEDIITLQQSVLYLLSPLILLGNLESPMHYIEREGDKDSLDLYLDNDILIDIADLSIVKKGEKIPLTNIEVRILLFLYKNKNKVIETEILMERAELSNSSSLYVHIKNLRNKIEKNPQNPAILKSIRKRGYILQIIS